VEAEATNTVTLASEMVVDRNWDCEVDLEERLDGKYKDGAEQDADGHTDQHVAAAGDGLKEDHVVCRGWVNGFLSGIKLVNQFDRLMLQQSLMI
jgi:hypothetical protein